MSQTVTMTLTEFLMARIAEDDERDTELPDWHVNVEHHASGCALITWLSDYNPSCDCGGGARWAAECDAKRRIVELCRIGDWTAPDVWPLLLEEHDKEGRVLEVLALPYAEHPDYREEWKP